MFNNDKRFDIDLKWGQVYERQLADMLQNKKVEVKSERDLWTRTGNIAIEFESRGIPSGIATTEAEFWFHNLVKDDVVVASIVLPTETLRNYIKVRKPYVVKGGDDLTSKLYLVRLNELFGDLGRLA